ncbi:MAG: sporulation integral membrane protein YtvI [Ruminococcaceae bacterium]|nr:sporulation integral membrane protein YtvI [Oscillospiraceae bacterium]
MIKTKGSGFLLKKIILSVLSLVIIAALIFGTVKFLPVLLSGAGQILWLFLPFVAAYIVSLLVNPFADALQKRLKMPRGLSAILVVLVTVGVIGGIITGVIWKIVEEIREIYYDLPLIWRNIQSAWYSVSDFLSELMNALPESMQTALDSVIDQTTEWISGFAVNTTIVQSAGNFAKKLPSVFISTIVFMLSLYFMVADAKTVSEAVKKPFTETFLARVGEIKKEAKKYVGGYVKAQLTIMCIFFFIIFIGLSLLKVDYALIIALVTALLDALPIFGSGAVLWPWALVSFIMGRYAFGVSLIIIYLVLVLIRQLIEPKIVSKNIGMHPLLTLMSMYVGYRTLSFGGMIFGPILLMFIISLYRVRLFDEPIKFMKSVFLYVKGKVKNIKTILDDEGE